MFFIFASTAYRALESIAHSQIAKGFGKKMALSALEEYIISYGSFEAIEGRFSKADFSWLQDLINARMGVVQQCNREIAEIDGYTETKAMGLDLEAALTALSQRIDMMIHGGTAFGRKVFSFPKYLKRDLERVTLGMPFLTCSNVVYARGKFSVIYEGVFLRKDCVIKRTTMPDRYMSREGCLLTALCHPNIIQAYHADETELLLEKAMHSLDEMIEAVDCPVVIHSLAMSCLEALFYLHTKGIIHGDVWPGSILIMENGRIKLGGFGNWSHQSEPYTCDIPKPLYAAPEMYGVDGVEKQSCMRDMWAFGVLLYQLLGNGKLFIDDPEELSVVFAEGFKQEMFDLLLEGDISSSSELDPEGLLYRVMKGCLLLDPKKRLSAKGALQIMKV